MRFGPNNQSLSVLQRDEVSREGFPEKSAYQFVRMFCGHNRCTPRHKVNRIEFEYADYVDESDSEGNFVARLTFKPPDSFNRRERRQLAEISEYRIKPPKTLNRRTRRQQRKGRTSCSSNG